MGDDRATTLIPAVQTGSLGRRRAIETQASGKRYPRGRPAGVGLWLLAALWFVILFEPQWWLYGHGVGVLLKAPLVLLLALGTTLLVGAQSIPEWRRQWTWFPPLFAFIAICVITAPFAPNRMFAKEWTQFYFLMWFFVVSTITLVDTARRAELLLLVYALQFVLWGIIGDSTGQVIWHTTLANFDGFGSFMVIGGGLCAFLAQALEKGWLRRALGLGVALCVIGVVTSFARGAALGAIVVFALVWLRARRKGAMFAATILAAGLVVATETVVFDGAYWTELGTIAQGTDEATGEDRWEMWRAAARVFKEHPILGVGAGNWGVAASELIRPGELGGMYENNTGRFYGRQSHNSYVQTMAEEGIAGLLVCLWILVDFWRRNLAIRTEAAQQRWKELGGRLRLRPVAYGLEAAMIGWLCIVMFYTQTGKHWLFSILALNLLIHRLVFGTRPLSGRAAHHPFGIRRSRVPLHSTGNIQSDARVPHSPG